MDLQYFAEDDMLHIQLGEGVSLESEEVVPSIALDYGEGDRLLGIEIEDASERTDLSRLRLSALPVSDLVMSRQTSGG